MIYAAYELLNFHEKFLDKLILQYQYRRIWCRQKHLNSSLSTLFPAMEKFVICDLCSVFYKLPVVPIIYKGKKYFNFYFYHDELEDWTDLLIECKSCKKYMLHQPVTIKDSLKKYLHPRFWDKSNFIFTDKDFFTIKYFLGRTDYQRQFEKTCINLSQKILTYFTEDILVL